MRRRRDTGTWTFTHYDSRDDFFKASDINGAHSISQRGQRLDLLVVNRESPVTVVAFHGAIPDSVETYPRFDGRGIAAAAGVNLVSAADPSIAMGISLGWHLGNQVIGPLRPVLAPIIRHILQRLGTKQTILLGGSGGGFAAAHFAPEFPASVAFLFNPRLSLNRLPRGSIRNYLRVCHNLEGDLKTPTEYEQEYLRPFGPTDISELVADDPSQHILIYQNLLDENFLQTQLLPFVDGLDKCSNVRLRLSHDGNGHVYIPRNNARDIIGALSSDAGVETRFVAAGFDRPLTALVKAMYNYPKMYQAFTG